MLNTTCLKKNSAQIFCLLLFALVIAISAVSWTNYLIIISAGILLFIILATNKQLSLVPLYFLFSYVICGELLYSLGYLYFSKYYGIPAGLILDVPVITALLIFVLQRSSNTGRFVYDKLDILITIFLSLIFLNILYGLGKHPGIFNEARGFLYYLLYFPFIYYFNELEKLDKIKKLILWISGIYIITAILDALGFFLPYQYKITEKIFGVVQKGALTLRFHTIEAAFAIALFFLLLAILRSGKLPIVQNLSIVLMMCFMVIITFYSMTRSYQIGFLGGILFYLAVDIFFRRGVKISRYILFTLIFMGIFTVIIFLAHQFTPEYYEFVTSKLTQRWDTGFIQKEKSLGRRFEEINFFTKLFLEKPLLGHGIGKEQIFFARDRLKYKIKRYIKVPGPHNEFVYFLYTMGVIGTALYLTILFLVVIKSLKNIKILREKGSVLLYNIQISMITVIFTFMIISNADWRFRRAYDVVWIALFYALIRNISIKYRKLKVGLNND